MSKEEYKRLYRKLRRIERYLRVINSKPLSIEKAIKYTGLSKSHLYKLTHNKAIPHYKPEGKKLYFLKIDLDAYLLRNRVSTQAEIMEFAKKSKR